MHFIVTMLVVFFLIVLVVIHHHVRNFGPEPPFKTEDDASWIRRRWIGLVD